MAFAFDTLGYAKKLREHGVPQDQAEAHAEAAREFIMAELVTKLDLSTAVTSLRQELHNSVMSLRQEIDSQTLRLTVRTGIMLAAGLSLMTALLGALIRFH
jgi:hypothetical protein